MNANIIAIIRVLIPDSYYCYHHHCYPYFLSLLLLSLFLLLLFLPHTHINIYLYIHIHLDCSKPNNNPVHHYQRCVATHYPKRFVYDRSGLPQETLGWPCAADHQWLPAQAVSARRRRARPVPEAGTPIWAVRKWGVPSSFTAEHGDKPYEFGVFSDKPKIWQRNHPF